MAWGTPPQCNPACRGPAGPSSAHLLHRVQYFLFPACPFPAHCRFNPGSWVCDGRSLRWNPKYRTLLPEERGHEGCPWVAVNFYIRTFILRPSGVSEPNEPDCRIQHAPRWGGHTLSMRWVGPTCSSLVWERGRIHIEEDAGKLSPG